ncbi:uncharacterized protein TNCV_2045971 [Trichonephila clavipes]|uniref:Uncharacterized protein n=1 Tax=Trichonephila clavipes TaxID=2585209 RepID=A0A8X6SRG0_TRICX|nr:uncharacterized protein TNCV_2045971 [Trichonephila clavipes]
MVQSNLLASCSVSGFLEAKHFNRSRQRWALSHVIRSTIINYVYKDLDLQIEQDVTAELTNHNIKNNIKQLQAFTDSFDQFINPFDTEVPKDLLINILFGKAASETVEKFLLNIKEHGEIKRKTFIAECEQDDSRFEKSIKKTQIDNVSIDYAKKKNWWKTAKSTCSEGFIWTYTWYFYRLQSRYGKFFTYPITPVPLSLCHFDGGIFYNVPGMTDVDAVRLQPFINTYMVSDVNEEFIRKNVKNLMRATYHRVRLKTLASTCEFAEQENGLIRDRIVLGIKDSGLQERHCEKIASTLKKRLKSSGQLKQAEKQIRNIKYDTATINLVKENQNKPKTRFNCKKFGRKHKPRECPACSGKFVPSARRKPIFLLNVSRVQRTFMK